MMFILILFFFLVCGIAACLVLVQKGVRKIWPQQMPVNPHSPVPRAEQCATDDAHNRAQSDRPLQRRIRDLNALFALYQSGGLSLEEYERLKRDLIYHDRLINNALNASS
jgi:hypothetical protein